MVRNFTKSLVSSSLTGILFLGIAVLSAAPISAAQHLEPASPPIADPTDTRFVGVHEDWTTPALTTSTLKAIPPLLGYPSDFPTYTMELNEVQWRAGDPLDLYVIKPKGVKKPPVIVYLYSYNYDTDVFKSPAWQRAVTKDGFAAVGFCTALTGHRYHDRPLRQWFVSELQESLADSAHDVQMVLNYLAGRDDLDMNRVGIFAEGSGASIAILASAVDPRIKAIDAVGPWGDWPAWMANSPFVPKNERDDYVKPDYLKKVAALDPVTWVSKVQAAKFRLQDATFDPTTPKASQEKLRAAVPASATVVVYNTPQELNAARDHNKVIDWLRDALRSLPDPPAGSSTAAALNKQ